MSLTSLLRRLARIGNKCPPLIAKQYLTLFSRNTRPINAPPSSLAISNLLVLPSFASQRWRGFRAPLESSVLSVLGHPATFQTPLQGKRASPMDARIVLYATAQS